MVMLRPESSLRKQQGQANSMTIHRSVLRFALAALVLLGSGRPPVCGQTTAEDESILKKAGIDASDASLLAFLHGNIQPSDADRRRIQKLIEKLAKGAAAAQQQAAADLEKLGPKAASLLQRAVRDSHDAGFTRRANACLQRLNSAADNTLVSAVVRLLEQRHRPDAIPALLAYLPRVHDDELLEEFGLALSTLAVRDGVINPSLTEALRDKAPLLRATAADALCRAAGHRAVPRVRPLLQDANNDVRLHAARALSQLSDAEAIPVLIKLIGEPAQASQADGALRQIALEQSPKDQPGADKASREKSAIAWSEWWSRTDGRALLEAVRRAVPDDAVRQRVQALIAQLGDDDYAVREKASRQLTAGGAAAASLLRLSLHDADPEIAHRAGDCLKELEKHADNVVPHSAARLLALRKPAGAAEALLAYLPLTDSEETTDEIGSALTALAVADPQTVSVLLASLSDKNPLKRAAAATALARTPAGAPPEARALLHDPDATVRLAVAQTLTEMKDRSAVPALIALFGDVPAKRLWHAEEMLRRLAGRDSPEITIGEDKETAQKCREAWEAWWRKHGATVELARLDETPRLLGYTLIVQMDGRRGGGQVCEIAGPDNKQRWRIDGLSMPMDAQVLPGNRVLIAEYQGMRVTERNLKGDILWERAVNLPINVQRLANGSTFIATQQQLIEVDSTGKETAIGNPTGMNFMAARKLRDGGYGCVTGDSMYMHLDAKGKQIKTFPIGQASFAVLDVLPNGHVLVPQTNEQKVVEFDEDGKSVWEAKVVMPGSVSRLPNGHTLVASQATQTIQELDHTGSKVWEYRGDGRVWQAKRR